MNAIQLTHLSRNHLVSSVKAKGIKSSLVYVVAEELCYNDKVPKGSSECYGYGSKLEWRLGSGTRNV